MLFILYFFVKLFHFFHFLIITNLKLLKNVKIFLVEYKNDNKLLILLKIFLANIDVGTTMEAFKRFE